MILNKYQVALYATEEGYAVRYLALPGCWSQGETEAEAMENIRDAISEYFAAAAALNIQPDAILREVEVAA